MNLKDGDLATPVPLDHFMEELGVLMRLPKRRDTRPIAVVASAPARARRVTLRSAALGITALSLAAVVGWTRLAPAPRAAPLPSALRGEWRTANPNYRKRVLSFTEDRVGLSMSESETPSLHPVVSLTSRQVADTTVLAMTYQDEGGPVDFRVSLVEGSRPMLWLSNPPGVVWERSGGSAKPAPGAEPARTPSAAGTVLPTGTGARAWEH